MNIPVALAALPTIVAISAIVIHPLRRLRLAASLGGVGQAIVTLAVAIPVLRGAAPPTFLVWFRLDGMAAWIIAVNAIVYAAAMVGAARLLDRPDGLHLTERGARAMFAFSALFIVVANSVVCAADLGALWVMMEATTLVTAPLIFLRGTRESVEATWKYLILCGVGIAFALLGTVLMMAAAGRAPNLNVVWLTEHAGSLRPSLLRTSFVFFLMGYGTKAGLFPVHNWLPDAHSEAPAPVSALLSGALLNCAMVGLWRVAGILNHSDSHTLLLDVLVPMGALTVLAAGVMLVRQQDLKRMWAYSSIENMGVLAVATGFGAAPIFALHALAHSLGKTSAFLMTGNVARAYGTVKLRPLSGVLRRYPALGFAVLAAGAAVMGAPPFASFISEWLLLARAGDLHLWGVLAALLAGLALSFVAVMFHLGRVVFGAKGPPAGRLRDAGSLTVSVVLLIASGLAFFAVTPGILDLLGRVLPAGGRT